MIERSEAVSGYTKTHATAVKGLLSRELINYRNVVGVGIWKAQDGWQVKVNLVKEHKWWHRKLPGIEVAGVPVVYEVVGRTKAL